MAICKCDVISLISSLPNFSLIGIHASKSYLARKIEQLSDEDDRKIEDILTESLSSPCDPFKFINS